MKPVSINLFAAVALLTLSACASPSDYPSLAHRPAERVSGSAEPVTPEPAPPAPQPPSAELTRRLAQLEDHARDAHGRFTERRAAAERLVANGASAPTGSESWAVASVALAELESLHSEAMVVLADLDQLDTSESVAHTDAKSGDGLAIAASRDRILQWLGDEDQVLAALRERLGA